MEVLPFSGVRYVGESECPQQGSGTTFGYDEESSCPESEKQVEAADLKADAVMLNAEETQDLNSVGDQWSIDGLPTSEGCSDGKSYFDFELEGVGQKVSCDSHDCEDDNLDDHFPRPGFLSENSPMVDTVEGGMSNINQEAEPSIPEAKWLEQDEPLAVWVKWRGKWQAGIRCARADCPLSTLRAKPTHDRKKYLVIFFPRTRNYSWADMLLVRPINEFPQPIAYKTHRVGVKSVKDLTLARRFIMQKLAVSMLNVLEQLNSEALVETARNVVVWKEFALEASRCKGYSNLGMMLLKLQNMILQYYISSNWLQNSLQSWVQRCQNANSAESLELLKEELVDSISWNEVNSLPKKAAQLELGSELKTWKHEVMKWFSTSHPINSSGDSDQLTSQSMLATGLQTSRKRPKLEIRRAEVHASQVETQNSHQDVTVEIGSGLFNSHDIVNTASLGSKPSNDEVLLEVAPVTGSPGSRPVRWGEIVVEAGNSTNIQSEYPELTPMDQVVSLESLDPVNKNRQCVAFIEGKGRQCERWATDGDVYCCVHMVSPHVGNLVKPEATVLVDSPMCGGTTVLGTKCKHRSLPGSPFCKKHQRRDDQMMTSGLPDKKLKRKQEDLNKAETSNCTEIAPVAGREGSLLVAPISVVSGESFNISSSNEISEQKDKENDATEMVQCIGLCSQDGYEPCLESAKKHSLYCDKHLPSWLKRARNGKSRIVSKDVFLELLKNCHSREQKLNLHRACEVFYKLFKSLLSLRNPVPKEVQFQTAFSEASKDVGVTEHLKKLVCSEKQRLKRIWGFGIDENAQNSTSITELVPVQIADGDHENANIIKCKICSEKFSDDQVLGSHWMETHKKEAQWLFRGYVCALCLDSFTNKKVLETHVQERHCAQFVEQCMLLQCIPCGSHFGNPEELWSHVLSVHADKFRLANSDQKHNLSISEHSLQKAEVGKSTTTETMNNKSQSAIRKLICRFCGLKFDLLPDLGRHHQAAHMGPNSDGPRLSKKGLRFYSYKLKSGRPTRPKFKKGLGSAAYRIRNRNAQSLKKPIQSLNLISSTEIEVQPHQSEASEASSLGKLTPNQCSAVAKTLFSEIKKTKHRPNNSDILSIARSTCCKINLQASLQARYGILPERIYLKAAKLCSEHNILVTWHQDGFICPRGCKRNVDPHGKSQLVPRSDDVFKSNSSFPLNPVTNGWKMDESHYVIDSQHFNQEAKDKPIVLCDDISFGQESVPIVCVVDENLLGSLHIVADGSDGQITIDSLPWESFTYITKPLLDGSLTLEAESAQLGCTCGHSICSPGSCDHVYLFNNDYDDAKDIYGKPMHGRFPYDERGRIILEEGYLVYECNQRCRCSKACRNRVLQNGVQVKLEIFKTETKGWAVRAREAIVRGTFICEYIGEVISEQEANERRNRYGEEHCRYFFEIDAHVNDMSRLIEGQTSYVIDATNNGNVSRFINHSCSPNLVNHQVLVESMDCQLAHIGLYASRDIAANEELTYDFRYKLSPGDGCQCLCGASNCRGRLY